VEKFSSPKLRDVLEKTLSFLNSHKLHLAAGAAILLLLILGGVVISSLSGSRGDPAEASRETSGEAGVRTLIPPEEAFLPNERERLLDIEEQRYREPRTPWEEELVEEFWNPVRETAIDALMDESREEIDQLFEQIE
jgi:hypothetical protein